MSRPARPAAAPRLPLAAAPRLLPAAAPRRPPRAAPRLLPRAAPRLPLAVALLLLLWAAGCATAQVGSVGAVLGVERETGDVFVREAREGLAADKAGLRPGDEILMIDGVYVRDLGAAAVRDKLRGPPGSRVELTIVRGEEVLRVTVTREPLAAPSAPPPPAEERIAP